jgi:hypothetical protein
MGCNECKRDVSVHAKGLCGACYARLLKYGNPTKRKVKRNILCDGCGKVRPHKAKGLCGTCYMRLLRTGTEKPREKIGKPLCSFCGKRRVKAKGLCDACYARKLKTGSVEYKNVRGKCSYPGCDNQHQAKGYCWKHYKRVQRNGDAGIINLPKDWGERVKHPLYQTWCGMRQRCNNQNSKDYKNYGGRGISICEKWEDFWAFVKDVGVKPSKEFTLDRIDCDGNYEPANVKWSTPAQQAQNKTNSVVTKEEARIIKILNSKGMTAVDISKTIDMPYDNVYSVIHKNTFSNI